MAQAAWEARGACVLEVFQYIKTVKRYPKQRVVVGPVIMEIGLLAAKHVSLFFIKLLELLLQVVSPFFQLPGLLSFGVSSRRCDVRMEGRMEFQELGRESCTAGASRCAMLGVPWPFAETPRLSVDHHGKDPHFCGFKSLRKTTVAPVRP